MNYLFHGKKMAVQVFRAIFILSTFSGVIVSADAIWTMGDIGAGIMTWLNIVAILLLSRQAVRMVKDYQRQRREGLDPVFHPADFGIDDPDHIWDKYAKKKQR